MTDQQIRIETRGSCGSIKTDRGCSENVAENLTTYFFRKGREQQGIIWQKVIKGKIRELKKRKKNLIHENSKWAMEMAIREFEELI